MKYQKKYFAMNSIKYADLHKKVCFKPHPWEGSNTIEQLLLGTVKCADLQSKIIFFYLYPHGGESIGQLSKFLF